MNQINLAKFEEHKELILKMHAEGLLYYDIDRHDWVTKEELVSGTDLYAKIERLENYISSQVDSNSEEIDDLEKFLSVPADKIFEQKAMAREKVALPKWIDDTLTHTLQTLYESRPIPALPDSNPEWQKICLEKLKFNYDSFSDIEKDYLAQNILTCELGMNWIPNEVYEQFIADVLDISATVQKVEGHYFIHTTSKSYKDTREYGSTRYRGHEILQSILNKQQLKVTKKTQNGRTEVNVEETIDIQNKAKQLQAAFRNWVWQDLDRTVKLTELYNRTFNSVRTYYSSGEHLELPGLAPGHELTPEQKNCVWRIIKSRSVGLFAQVGFGKTWVLVCAAMELKRLGLAKRPMIIVLNSTLAQFVAKAKELYPQAKILYRIEEQFPQKKSEQRAILLNQIRNQDWDMIILSHEQFNSIPVSAENQERILNEELKRVEEQISNMQKSTKKHNTRKHKEIIRMLKCRKNFLKQRLESLYSKPENSILPMWESLKIDALFVDESQNFKNLFFETNLQSIAGIPNRTSQRSEDLYFKILEIYQRNGRVVFSTGTPISNSIAEMYTLMRYLAPELLERTGLQRFDDWAAQFGEIIEQPEVDVRGKYKIKQRFVQFKNLPELIAMFKTFAIVYTEQNIESYQDKPSVFYQTISTTQTKQQQKYMSHLSKRADRAYYAQSREELKKDNMAKICQEARLCTLDTGLLGQPDYTPYSKLNTLVKNIYLAYQVLKPVRGVQIVFCDLVRYVYDYITEALVQMGIPRQHIQAVQTAKSRDELYRLAQAGHVRIILASTEVAGAGVNIQNRLAVVHHANPPWRPSDILQREGRIHRRGNQFKKVVILRYVCQSTKTDQLSFDTFSWQQLENKMKFYSQILDTQSTAYIPRSIEDVYSQNTLSYAQVKAIASGNSLLLEKTEIEHKVKQLQIEYANWRRTQIALSFDRQKAEQLLPELERQLQHLNNINLDEPKGFLGNDSFESWEQFAELLKQGKFVLQTEQAGKIYGLPIAVTFTYGEDGENQLKLRYSILNHTIRARKPDTLQKEIASIISELIDKLEKRAKSFNDILARNVEDVFPKKSEMDAALVRLTEIEQILQNGVLSHNVIDVDLEEELDDNDENDFNCTNDDSAVVKVSTSVPWRLCKQLEKEANQVLEQLYHLEPLPDNYQWLRVLLESMQESFATDLKLIQSVSESPLNETSFSTEFFVEENGQISLF